MSVPYWVALRLCFENTFNAIRAQELEFQMRWCKIETILAVGEIGKTGLFSGFQLPLLLNIKIGETDGKDFGLRPD